MNARRAKELFSKWLNESAETPFAAVRQLMHDACYALKYSKNAARMLWIDAYRFTFDGEEGNRHQFHDVLVNLQNKAELLLQEMSFGDHLTIPDVRWKDHIGAETRTFYSKATTVEGLTPIAEEVERRLIGRVLEDPKLQAMWLDPSSTPESAKLNSTMVKAYLDLDDKLQCILAALFHISSGGPVRGPSLRAIRISNEGTLERNIFHDAECLVILIDHCKVT